MSYVIRYTDGAYEFKQGSGFPCTTLEEARKFETQQEAEEHSEMLCDVLEILEIE